MNQHEDHKEPRSCTVRDQNRVLQGQVALGQGILCGRHAALERRQERYAAVSAPCTAPTRQSLTHTAASLAYLGEAGSSPPDLGLKEAHLQPTQAVGRRKSGVPPPPERYLERHGDGAAVIEERECETVSRAS